MKMHNLIICFLVILLQGTIGIAEEKNVFQSQNMMDSLMYPGEGISKRVSGVQGIKPGEVLELGTIKNPGIIRHLWFTAQSKVPQIYGMLIIRIYWDGEKKPSVQTPLGDFFGVGFGKEVEFKSFPLEMFPAGGENHAALNSYFPMPFRKTARVTIENRSARNVNLFFWQIDYEKLKSLPKYTLYFHANWRRENPVKLHEPFTILETKGKGHYIGTMMNYHLLTTGGWVEGGNDIYIDGEKEPSLPGTGAEDYFGHAWGFREQNNGLFHGTSYGPQNNKMTAYRFHILDPVRFTKSIKVVMKCHGWDVGDRQDDYSCVAYWYQSLPHPTFGDIPKPDYDYLEVDKEYQIPISEKKINIPKENLPERKNISSEYQSYEESGHYLEENSGKMALDGKIETKWCEVEHADNHWLAVGFGKKRNIIGFILRNASLGDEPEGFNIQQFKIYKKDSINGDWDLVIESIDSSKQIYSPENREIYAIKLHDTISAEFIKLVVTRPGLLDSIVRLPEFEIYGN